MAEGIVERLQKKKEKKLITTTQNIDNLNLTFTPTGTTDPAGSRETDAGGQAALLDFLKAQRKRTEAFRRGQSSFVSGLTLSRIRALSALRG